MYVGLGWWVVGGGGAGGGAGGDLWWCVPSPGRSKPAGPGESRADRASRGPGQARAGPDHRVLVLAVLGWCECVRGIGQGQKAGLHSPGRAKLGLDMAAKPGPAGAKNGNTRSALGAAPMTVLFHLTVFFHLSTFAGTGKGIKLGRQVYYRDTSRTVSDVLLKCRPE